MRYRQQRFSLTVTDSEGSPLLHKVLTGKPAAAHAMRWSLSYLKQQLAQGGGEASREAVHTEHGWCRLTLKRLDTFSHAGTYGRRV